MCGMQIIIFKLGYHVSMMCILMMKVGMCILQLGLLMLRQGIEAT
jgi:hypothetical protein